MAGTTEHETVTVYVDGEPIIVDAQTTTAEVKQVIDAGDDTVSTYCASGRIQTVPDDEFVVDHVFGGQNLATWTDWTVGSLPD